MSLESRIEQILSENEVLRSSLAEMVEYAGCHEMWQEDHQDYVVRACAALGISVPDWITPDMANPAPATSPASPSAE